MFDTVTFSKTTISVHLNLSELTQLMSEQPDFSNYTAGALKVLVAQAGLSHAHCVEKAELRELAIQAHMLLAKESEAATVAAEPPEVEQDVIGPVPVPMTGGDNEWHQFCTHAAPVRSVFTSTFFKPHADLKPVHHQKLNGELYDALLSIEAGKRIEEILRKEKAAGIERKNYDEDGKRVHTVCMTVEDSAKFKTGRSTVSKQARTEACKSLEETQKQRADQIAVPLLLMQAVDKCILLCDAAKEAVKELHKIDDMQALQEPLKSVGLPTLPVFAALKARAKKRKEEASSEDRNVITQLMLAAEMECGVINQRLDSELCPRQQELNLELALYEKEKKEALAVLADDDADEASLTAALRKKLRARAKVIDKQSELASCEATIEQLRKDLQELGVQLAEFKDKHDKAPPSAKKART